MKSSRKEKPIDPAPAGWTEERRQFLRDCKVSNAQLKALEKNLTPQKTIGPARVIKKSDWKDLTEDVAKGIERAIKMLTPLVKAQEGTVERSEIFKNLPPDGSEVDYTPEQEALVAAAHQFERDNIHYLELYRRLEHADGPLGWDEVPARVLDLNTLYGMLQLAGEHACRELAYSKITAQDRRRASSQWVYEVDYSLKSGFLLDQGYHDIDLHSAKAQRIFSESREYRFAINASASPFYDVCLLCREVLDGPESDGPESAIRAYKDRIKRGSIMFPIPGSSRISGL